VGTLNVNRPILPRSIMDSLVYWVSRCMSTVSALTLPRSFRKMSARTKSAKQRQQISSGKDHCRGDTGPLSSDVMVWRIYAPLYIEGDKEKS
jgi:hypothetical protein